MTLAQKTRLLKKESVVLAETTCQTPASVQDPRNVRATVIENTETHAVIEVECLCGSAIQIVCEYTA